MPDEALHPCVYHVLRYTPNLVRDEWVNIGILIYDPGAKRAKARLMEELDELARVRRLHPTADLNLLQALPAELDRQLTEQGENVLNYIARLDETLSNVLQLSPRRAVLTTGLEAELDRLYQDHVEPPRYRPGVAEMLSTRAGIRARVAQVFRRADVLPRMERRVPVEQFTYPGDPLRLDFSYRRNGTRGFVHALALARDPSQAKVLAYTAEAIRASLPSSEFCAVTETEPRLEENPRHRFVASLLKAEEIAVVPVSRLEEWVSRLKPSIQ